MKVLFLLKKDSNYGYYSKVKTGLYNSALFLSEALEKRIIGTDCKLEICEDANSIDKEVHTWRPRVVIIEALWVTPAKLNELAHLHPRVTFVVRIHSNLPFLSNEGVAVEWIKAYDRIARVKVSFNKLETSHDFGNIGIENVYLPNIYGTSHFRHEMISDDTIGLAMMKRPNKKRVVNIGCFGAIRPLKNQLIQASAAIGYANATDNIIHFHMNGTRVEQAGEATLKNIRALFANTPHKLIEHGWLDHKDFVELVRTMDVGMQVSLTESFNIVAADFAAANVPIIVSPEIDWMPSVAKVLPYSVEEVMNKLHQALDHKILFTVQSMIKLHQYNHQAVSKWSQFFKLVKRS